MRRRLLIGWALLQAWLAWAGSPALAQGSLPAPAAAASAAAQGLALTPAEREFMAQHPVLRAHNEKNWAPYNFNRNGKPQGYVIDLLALLAAKLGVRVDYVSGPDWDGFQKMLRDGRLDLMPNMVQTEVRDGFALFTEPVIAQVPAIVSRVHAPVGSVAELRGRRVAVVRGFWHQEALTREVPDVRLVLVPDTLTALKAVAFGKADATLGLGPVLHTLMTENGLTNLAFSGEADLPGARSNHNRIGVRKDWPLLRSALDKALASLSLAELATLRQKWLVQLPASIAASTPSPRSARLALSAAEKAWVQANPVIRASNLADYPPYDFATGGSASGFGVELLNLLAERAGLQVRYTTGPPWSHLLERLKGGQLDLVQSAYRTEEREAYALFSEPYARERTLFVIRRGEADVDRVAQLRGKTVAVGKGWAQEEYLRKNHPDIKLLMVGGLEQMLDAVASGRADATLEGEGLVRYWIEKKNLRDLKLSGWAREFETGRPVSLHYMVRKGAPELVGILNKGLAALAPGELRELQRRWLVGDAGDHDAAPRRVPMTQEEAEFVARSPEVVLGVDPEFMPLVVPRGDGSVDGLGPEVLALIEQRTGLRFRVALAPWAETARKAEALQLDGVLLAQALADDQARFDFSRPYLRSVLAVVVKRGQASRLHRPDDLRGKRMAVLRDHFGMKWRAQSLQAQLVVRDTPTQVLQALLNGDADFAVVPETFGYLAAQRGLSGLLDVAFTLGEPIELTLALRKDWPALRSLVNKALADIGDTALLRLRAKWITQTAALTGGGRQISLSDEELNYLGRKGSLKLCVIADLMPYGGLNERGELEGITADLFKQMTERLGVRFDAEVVGGWASATKALAERRCDVMPFAADRPERRASMAFTRPHMVNPFVVATREGELFIRGAEDIGARPVGVLESFREFVEPLRQRHPGLKLVYLKSAEDGLNRVRQGELWGYLDLMPMTGYLLRKQGMQDLKIAGRIELEVADAMATRSDEPLLRDILQKGLDALGEDGRRAILNRWLGVRYEQRTDYRLLLAVGLGAGGVLLVVVWWNRRLARLNKALADAQAELQRTSVELQTVFDHAWIGVFVTGGEQRLLRMNRYCEQQVFRCAPGAYLGESTRRAFASDAAYQDFMREAQAQNAPSVTLEAQFCRRDGTPFLARATGSLIDPEDRAKGAIWLVTDITETRAAEERLRTTLRELEVIFQTTNVGLSFTKNRVLLRVNKALADLLGYSEGQLVGQSTRIYFTSDDEFESFGVAYARLEAGDKVYRREVTLRRVDGSARICLLSGSLIDPALPEVGAIWTYQDLSELRQAQAKLQRTSVELQAIFDHAWIGVFVTAGDRSVLRMNRFCEEQVFRCPAGAYLGRSTELLFPSLEAFMDFGRRTMAQNNRNVVMECQLKRHDGSLFLGHVTGSLIDPSDRSKGAIWLLTDVTEQHVAEEKLNNTLRELEAIVHTTNVGLAWSRDRRYLRVNKALADMLGYSEAELVGRSARLEYLNDADYQACEAAYPKLAAGLKVYRWEVPMRRADGSSFICLNMGSLVDPEDVSKGAIWSYQDVTELRQAQAQLQAARDDAVAKNALIEEQHSLVKRTLDRMGALLDNSGEGFLSFGRDLQIDEGHSRECQRIFGREDLAGAIPELLAPQDAAHRALLAKTLPLVIDAAQSGDALRCEAFIGLLPKEYALGARHFAAEYRPLADARLMLILRDDTDERRLRERLAQERLRLEFVVNALEYRGELLACLRDFETFRRRRLPDLLSYERHSPRLLAELLRQVHTFKGLFAQASLPTLPEALHQLEGELAPLREQGAELELNRIKQALGSVDLGQALEQDLAVLRDKLGDDFFSSERRIPVTAAALDSLEGEAAALYGAESRMLDLVRQLRFEPLRSLIEPHFKATEQLARRQGKQLATIEYEGDSPRVDPRRYGPFCKSLVNLFRNAVDHGIEDADTRLLADKPEQAKMLCQVQAGADTLTLTLADDGRGVDRAALRERALQHGLLTPAQLQALDAQGELDLVFLDGLSTRDQADAISGRGVGLAAIKHEVDALGGQVRLESLAGQGTRFIFTVPYVPALVVGSPDTRMQSLNTLLAPLPALMETFCQEHLQLMVQVDDQAREFDATALHGFTALIGLGSNMPGSIGLSIERPLLEEMTRRFEPSFNATEVESLADSVGGEIANTLVGRATVYYTHQARRVQMSTPERLSAEQYRQRWGRRVLRGYRGQCEAGRFTIFAILEEGRT